MGRFHPYNDNIADSLSQICRINGNLYYRRGGIYHMAECLISCAGRGRANRKELRR